VKPFAVSVLALAISASPAFAALVVSKAATSNVSCTADVCTPTAAKAVLNAGDLAAMLSSGDVTLQSNALAKDIDIHAPLAWTSASRLTLASRRGLSIVEPILVEGSGGLTIQSGVDYSITGHGRVEFWDLSSSLNISGQSYTLVNSLSGLAAAVAANWKVDVALAKSYDAAGDKRYTLSPVPTDFEGTFEGLGNSVSHLKLYARGPHGNPDIGLFAEIAEGGVVRDIKMVDTTMMAAKDGAEMGALASTNGGTIINAYASGRFTDDGMHGGEGGGLVGVNLGTIVSSHSDVTLDAARSEVGGLAAFNEGTIRDCSAGGAVSGVSAGGLVGENSSSADGGIFGSHATGAVHNGGGLVAYNIGTIQDSYATGNVTGALAGGLVGIDGGPILTSYATGTATAQDANTAYAGGLVAELFDTTLQDSYATGAVGATAPASYAGGAIGRFGTDQGWTSSIRTVYSTGAVSGSDIAGGFIGEDQNDAGYIASAYWDLNTSGVSDPSKGAGTPANDPGISGLTTAQFQSGPPSGFDPSVWAQSPSINNGYPYLIANPPQ